MPGWELMSNDSWFGASWTADCGPFIGSHNPVAAPAWIPADADEVDFYIGLPNPNGHTAGFADGSYDPGPIGDAYRYTGGSRDDDMSPGPAPGAHLFATFYAPGFADPNPAVMPSKPPLALVPGTHVRGGYGPYRVGAHWSEWIDNPVTTDAACEVAWGYHESSIALYPGTGHDGDSTVAPVVVPFPDTIDAPADLEIQRARSRTGAAVPLNDTLISDVAVWVKNVNLFDPSNTTFLYENSWLTSQEVVTFWRPSVAPEFPAGYFADHDLVEGIDYGPNPESGETEDFDGGPTVVSWSMHPITLRLDVDWEQGGDYWDGTSTRPGTKTGLSDTKMYLRRLPDPADAQTGPAEPFPWRDFLYGEPLAEAVLPAADLTATVFRQWIGTSETATDLDLSGITDDFLTILIQRSTQDPGFTLPVSDNKVFPNVSNNYNHDIAIFNMNATIPDFYVFHDFSTYPQVVLQQPRWRYWKLGTLVFPPMPDQRGPRLNQRGDGLGISGSPVRLAQRAGTSSRAPRRLGGANTYT